MLKVIKPFGVILSLLILGTLTLKMRSVSASVHDEIMTDDDRYYVPSSKWLRAFSLGHNEAIADLLWIKTVIYYGGRFSDENQDAEANYTVNYLKTAIELNPQTRSFYAAGSALTLFQNGGIVSEPTVKMSIELLEMGCEVFPNDGKMHFVAGFHHYYEMRPFLSKDPEDPKRKYHEEKGKKYIGRSALMENPPPYAAALAATLLTKDGMEEMAVAHLSAMLLKETDSKIRFILKKKLRSAQGEAAERDITQSELLLGQWRKDLPFVPYDFYLIIQPTTSSTQAINPLYYSNKLLGLYETEDVQ